MKFRTFVLAVMVAAFFTASAWAQGHLGMIRGKAQDAEGKPVVGATVELRHHATGRRVTLKTDKRGEFFSMGLMHGGYTARLLQGGQEMAVIDNVPIRPNDETSISFDLAEHKVATPSDLSQITDEQKKQLTDAQRKQLEQMLKDQQSVKNLNDLLEQADVANKGGDHETSISLLQRALEINPHHQIYGRLGEAQLSARKFPDALESFDRAITIQPTGAYYNNKGQALANMGRADEAMEAFNRAAEIEPASAGLYYFNMGAILTNIGQLDKANEAFDKSLAADPARAEAHYFKGINLLANAKTVGDKMVAPEGTAEAFNKYLQLQPNGRYADVAKQLLESIGAKVETQVGAPRRRR
jgi:tetratricopeptide (TPR) repeat protein